MRFRHQASTEHGKRSERSFKAALAALAIALAGRASASAQNHVDYKYELYTEDSDRILVHTHSALFDQKIAPGVALKGSLVYDGISGATPTGGPPAPGSHRVPVVEIDDIRRAVSLEPRITAGRHTIAPQISYSEEEDYKSTGLALNYLVDFNRRNTTLNLGLAHNFDEVQGFHLGNRTQRKQTTDLLLGLTQVLTPTTLFNATLTLGTANGYLSDPYKGFRFTSYPDPNALFPEKRPGHRTKQIFSTSLTQFFEPLDASAELTYRFYHDSHEISGHTVTLEWFQSIGRHVTLSPILRYYRQSEAYFYRRSFDADPSDTENPPVIPIPQFYSADYRLSELQTLTCGAGLTVKLGRQFFFDAAYKRYVMRGLDGGTPQSSFASAHVYTVGLRLHY